MVLVAAVVGAIAWYAYRSKQKRREALFVFATQHGLDYSREDTFDLPDSYGFALFRKGEAEPAATGHFVHVYVDRDTRRPAGIPPRVRAELENLLVT